MSYLGSYEKFLLSFLKNEYQFNFFHEHRNKNNELILRHDIDFNIEYALNTAKIENKIGIKSTYFFLLRSNIYNPFSKENFDKIKEIKNLGHTISIHFDPVLYKDIEEGLAYEKELFENSFDEKINIISIHRPNDFLKNSNSLICDIEHTYLDKYFINIKYASDSMGEWRFGNPLDSNAFIEKKTIHLLIHPIWWMINATDKNTLLKKHFQNSIESMRIDFANNCKPFKDIMYDF